MTFFLLSLFINQNFIFRYDCEFFIIFNCFIIIILFISIEKLNFYSKKKKIIPTKFQHQKIAK